METIEILRDEILNSDTINILKPLDIIISEKPQGDNKKYDVWRKTWNNLWEQINKELRIGEYGELRVRKSLLDNQSIRTSVDSLYRERRIKNTTDLSYGVAREIAEMFYRGFQEAWQLPTDSKTYECRGAFSNATSTNFTFGGRKGFFIDMKTGLGKDYNYLESIISEELGLVTPPLTAEAVGTKKLDGNSWAELTSKSKKYYDDLTKENFFKYILPY